MSVPGISHSVMSKIRSAITNKERHQVQDSTFDLIATIAKDSIGLVVVLVFLQAGGVAFPSGEVTLPKNWQGGEMNNLKVGQFRCLWLWCCLAF